MDNFVVPKWYEGDGVTFEGVPGQSIPDKVDLIFTCPPYFDLEQYTDNPSDISNMPFRDYLSAIDKFARKAFRCLAFNRFAVVVMGDVRDKDGHCRDLVGITKESMIAAGFMLYNEAVLLTAIGSLPVRVGRQFTSGRKLGRAHQHVLVFYKGDPAKIKLAFPSEIECGDLAGLLGGDEDDG